MMSALPPKADIESAQSECPLSANSGHRTLSLKLGRYAHLQRRSKKKTRLGETELSTITLCV